MKMHPQTDLPFKTTQKNSTHKQMNSNTNKKNKIFSFKETNLDLENNQINGEELTYEHEEDM